MEVFIHYFIRIVLPILIIGCVLLIVVLIINRYIYDSFSPRFDATKNEIDIFLTNLIFSPFDETHHKTEIEQFKKAIPFEKNWCKKLLLNEIIFLKQNLKGEVTNKFHYIYEQFDLFRYTQKLLKSRRFYLKCLGLFQLETLDYKKGKHYITPLLTHKNRDIKSRAFLALISLSPNKLESLIDFSHEITIAEEINIMDILHHKKTKMPANLKDWIVSENATIVKLGIKLMIFYNYTNENKKITELLKHNDKAVRHEVILAINSLFIIEAETELIQHFSHEDTENKLEIFNTLSKIGTAESENFIAQLLETKTDEGIKLDAVYCLYKINRNYFDSHFLDNEDVQKMVEHVKAIKK
ncbi:HEAT repeat domain-containing protein [Flavobacterium fluviatile]|uniref:HEAT repeat domain-containing protein n=1 Tax=Flavobacterium fluviatile TaxID=1862387 RepID=UPI0013D1C19E|nr:HEAT repeat domain-containing protein [Flavobacterium fluviatile]